MPRLARVVVPGVPLHVTQRGNRRQRTFFGDADYGYYVGLMRHWCRTHGVAIWAWCLMPNHVHLIAVPESEDGLRRAIGEVHRRYTRTVNLRMDWRGHLWQGRFASFPLDGLHLLNAARYVELNPVRAGMVAAPEDWRWSSARAHLTGEDDALCSLAPMLEAVPDWRDFLAAGLDRADLDCIRRHSRTGRPLGDDAFIDGLEQHTGRTLRPNKRGPKPTRRR